MVTSEKDTGRDSGELETRAPLGDTLALTLAIGVACFAVALAIVELLSTPKPLPGKLPGTENQHAESLLYVIGFVLILPAALFAVPRLADRIWSGPNARTLPLIAPLVPASLAAVVLVDRALPGGGGLVDTLIAFGVWLGAALAVLGRATRTAWKRSPDARLISAAWGAAAALALGAMLAFTHLASISLAALALGLVACALALAAYARRDEAGLPRFGRGWGAAIDAVAIALLLLAIPNLVIFGSGGSLGGFGNSVLQFHHDLWLGPANEVLAGRALLVDTASQYGVGPIYLLAGWFQLAPIGYGTLGFLDGALFALFFVAGYCVLRLAGTPRTLAIPAVALAVIALVYNLVFAVGSLPQHGPLRFGLPILLIAAAVAEVRFPRHAGGARAAGLVVLGLSSVWALEAFAYTAFTYAAIVSYQAWTRDAPGRLAWLVRRALAGAAACLGAQLVFVIATLGFTGELPDYGWYFAFLRAFLRGELADITYDFSRWSAGLALGVAYAASAAAFVLLVVRRRDLVAREPATLVAICATTAYGIALFSYLVDRSQDHVVAYVSLPALLAGTLWLTLLLRGHLTESRRARLAGLAFALVTAVLVFAVAWSSIGPRFGQSPLARAAPGGESLRASLHRLWHLPPLNPRASAGVAMLDRYMPGERRARVIAASDLATEILMRSGRSNWFPFSDPLEDSFVGSRLVPKLRDAVDELRLGDRILLENDGLRVIAKLGRQPSRDVLEHPIAVPSRLTGQQEWLLQRIAQRYALQVVARDPQGFVVVQLSPHG